MLMFFLFRLRKKEIRLRLFLFCEGESWTMTIYKNRCKISLHSLHGCCNSLIFKTSQCNVGQNALSLMSLDVTKSAMSDMEKQASLHGDVLIFSELRYPCNECNVFLKVNGSYQI